MYDRILFPTDGSETAASIFDYALDIAATHDATVHVLNVADTTLDGGARTRGAVTDALERAGQRVVEALRARAAERGVPVVTAVLRGAPDREIVDYGETSDVDLVVMPTHGRRGLERFLLGSVTERVVTTTTVPVLTVTPDADGERFTYPSHDVLVPTDGSRGADNALETGIDFASASDASLHLLHVVETASLGRDVRSAVADDELTERANEILDAARDTARRASLGDITTSVEYGRPFREIRSYVREHDVDVVVLGTHGETRFDQYVLGGVSSKLLRTSPVPVLVAHSGETDSSGLRSDPQ